MKIYNIKDDLSNIPRLSKKLNLCFGCFDGVHIAHQKIINSAVNYSSLPSAVITCEEIYKRDECLTSLEDRLNIFKSLNVDYVFILPLSSKIRNLSPEEFITKFLKKLNPNAIFVGKDARFGKDAKGDVALLKKHFDVHIVPFVKLGKNKISTRSIIELIKKGDIETANKLLGRPYEIHGHVVVGNKIGRTINFPTANIESKTKYVVPLFGAYKSFIFINGIPHLSITNVGLHPTIKKRLEPIVETHILDFDKDIYGKHVYLDFISFIRGEKKFKNLNELKTQITKDIKKVVK